jgi:dTDP-4-amino-4,6-dideoxygalactose transaminase
MCGRSPSNRGSSPAKYRATRCDLMNQRIPFFRHDLGQPELDMVADVFAGEILTTGAYVDRFEHQFAEYLGARHCLAVSHCTGALHMALLGLGIGSGDEVITTPMSFIATATAIMEAGATPVFVDVERGTGNIDAAHIEAAITPRTKAIVPVHLYGLMCDMPAIRSIADRHGLKIIEDSAHCIEGMRARVRPGQISDAAAFSFYATKNLTCGEGGALVVNDTMLYDKLRLLRLHGATKTAADRVREGYRHWDMVLMGWKYNMSNIEAALLLPQFSRLERKLTERTQLAARYRAQLARIPGIRTPETPADTQVHGHHIFPIWVDAIPRDRLVQHLLGNGVGTVVNYLAMHLLTWFRENMGTKPGDFPVAEEIGDKVLSLPFYPGMPVEHIDQVCVHIEAAVAGDSIVRAVNEQI